MRKRFLAAAVCILGLPLWFSPTQGDNLKNSAPFAAIALAGHTMTGGIYCGCPGEEYHQGLNIQGDDSTQQDDSTTQGDLSIEIGIAFLALALWLKLRA